MEGRGFIFTVFATFCFLSIIIEAPAVVPTRVYKGTGRSIRCYSVQCCPSPGMSGDTPSYPENSNMDHCCNLFDCKKRKRGNNIPEQRFIQDELLENDQAIVRFLLQNEKYKADFAQYLEQSWPDDKSAFLQWLSQELKI